MNTFITNLTSDLTSAIIAAVLTGSFFRRLDTIKEQRKLIAILRALKNEFDYNSIHRGNEQSPFQNYWLKQALSMPEFYELCKPILQDSLEISELINDANIEQLGRRKRDNGTSLVPSDVQDLMKDASSKIDQLLPNLKRHTNFFGFYLLFLRA